MSQDLKILRTLGENSAGFTHMFWCPGCKCGHGIRVRGEGPTWAIGGTDENPTVAPSVVVRSGGSVCHLHIRDGQIQFLSDCTHELRDKTIPMERF